MAYHPRLGPGRHGSTRIGSLPSGSRAKTAFRRATRRPLRVSRIIPVAVAALLLALPPSAQAQGEARKGMPHASVAKSGTEGWRTEVAPPADPALASAVEIIGDARRTRFSMLIDRTFQFQVFTVDKPYRVIVDIPDLAFSLSKGRSEAKGLVGAFRYGSIAPGRARIVIDTKGPVSVDAANVATRPGQRTAITESNASSIQSIG